MLFLGCAVLCWCCASFVISYSPLVAATSLCRYYLSGNDAFRLKLQLPITHNTLERRRKEKEAILGFPEDMPLDLDVAAAGMLPGQVPAAAEDEIA